MREVIGLHLCKSNKNAINYETGINVRVTSEMHNNNNDIHWRLDFAWRSMALSAQLTEKGLLSWTWMSCEFFETSNRTVLKHHESENISYDI